MSIAKIFQQGSVTLYAADTDTIFEPYPAKSVLPLTQQPETFTLKVGQHGKTPFQIIVASEADKVITGLEADGVTCLALEGMSIEGKPFKKQLKIEAGKPWPLWCLMSGPLPGKRDFVLRFEGDESIAFSVTLEVSEAYDHRLDDKDSLARIEWLNCTEGNEKTVTKGYPPVACEGSTIHILGRDITLSREGFIESIKTHFTGANDSLSDNGRELLAKPLRYSVYEAGKEIEWTSQGIDLYKEDETACRWTAVNTGDGLKLTMEGTVEFDGTVKFCACIENAVGRTLSVRLCHDPLPYFSKYFMGLGKQGGRTPDTYRWEWDDNRHQDSVWCGAVNGGVFIRPTAENIQRPFVNIYFHHSRNYMPLDWVNDGKGYFSLDHEKGELFFDSGEYVAGERERFCADILITPFKMTNRFEHWNTHYYHKNFNIPYTSEDVSEAENVGCTHINVHHGNDTLPFINYPMYDISALKELADMAHARGLGLKPYYTVRELTTRLPELPVFRSLGTEIYPEPKYQHGGVYSQGGTDPFITEHFGDQVITAWKHTFVGGRYDGITDPSVITNPHGRICNFYLGGLSWLIDTVGIDGLYIDDTAYDKTILRRARRIFDRKNPNARLDFHTCNHFMDTGELGFGFGHNMLIYMELFPYLDSLWVGEGYDYDNTDSDYWLTEISGLPFGLMSEMLEGSCNVWRGMLFGMTSRYPFYRYYGGASPVPVWNMRKAFDKADMIGFWEKEQPIYVDNRDVLCTVYRDNESERYLCCFANFGKGAAHFKLCGMELSGKHIYAPFMEAIQDEQTFDVHTTFVVSEKGGLMLIIE